MCTRSLYRLTALFSVLCVVAMSTSIDAQGFRLTVASAIAGNSPQFKDALFVVRTEGCPEPAAVAITATGEGLVDGVRRSVAIEPAPLVQQGAYAITRRLMPNGTWIVHLTARC